MTLAPATRPCGLRTSHSPIQKSNWWNCVDAHGAFCCCVVSDCPWTETTGAAVAAKIKNEVVANMCTRILFLLVA
jgi:hypothetical protein